MTKNPLDITERASDEIKWKVDVEKWGKVHYLSYPKRK